MFRKKAKDAITLVAAGTDIVGEVSFSGELYVYGKVLGNVSGTDDAARLTICAGGEIRGDVRVANVVVNGRVEGDIFAKRKVEIAARASLKGNVYYKLIEMQLGARIEGQLVHTEELPTQDEAVRPSSVRKSNEE
jgi:cytoskeletal protein CcmA (bactofilin family)